MFKNFFKTAHRNITRNKLQSAIQVISLTIGITAFLLIGLFIRYELNHDKFNKNYDLIYRLEYGNQVGLPTAPGHIIKENIPEVNDVVRLVNWEGRNKKFYLEFKSENDPSQKKMLYTSGWFMCDSSIFNVFTFVLLKGDPEKALTAPNSCVLSESIARELFGEKNPIGEMVSGYTITGIIQDVKNSHIDINLLISLNSLEEQAGFKRGESRYLNSYFFDPSYITYLLLEENSDPQFVANRINNYLETNRPKDENFLNSQNKFILRPMNEIYFKRDVAYENNYCKHGNLKLLRALFIIASFTLLIAIINYINIATARSSMRAKEVDVRKIVGSSDAMLIIQFLSEALLIALFSTAIALTIVQLLIPAFNHFLLTEINTNVFGIPYSPFIFIGFSLTVGIISGLYPAIFLMKSRKLTASNGEQGKVRKQVIFRRILLTSQFTVSIIMIVGVLVFIRQLKFMKSADLGFTKDPVLVHRHRFWGMHEDMRKEIKDKLLLNPDITAVAFSASVQGGEQEFTNFGVEVNGIHGRLHRQMIDPDFLDLMEIEIIEGRNYSWDNKDDKWWEFEGIHGKHIWNEAAVRKFQLESPVGHVETYYDWQHNNNDWGFEIVGVVEDFNFTSLHKKIQPTIYVWVGFLDFLNIKIKPNNISSTINFIEKEIKLMSPDIQFDYTFLEESFNKQYKADERTILVISSFAIISILIASLGLFGISSFMAANRTKEIGIRKSMGASVSTVFLLISKEFLKWIGLAILIANPAAWFIIKRWLITYAYHTSISPGIFILTILITLIVTYVTVTWQTLKTAKINPTDSLRYE